MICQTHLRSGGLAGIAIKTGEYFFCNDFETDPKMSPWRKRAMKIGYKSAIALPLAIESKVIGTFMTYSS